MQGTVKEYDEATRTGAVLTDDRVEVAIEPSSCSVDQVRMLRQGQRVRFDVAEADGRKVASSLRLVTF